MVDCSEIRPLLSAFGDGELEPPELLKVARHIAGCPDCEREAADFSAVGVHLRDVVEAGVSSIPLEGFAEAVQARITQLRPSLWSHFGRWLESVDERVSASLSIASAAMAIAALTAIMLTPYAREYTAGHNAQVVASAQARPAAAGDQAGLAETVSPAEKTLAEDSRAIISRLESENPAVAVWSEPRTDTTVIWLPEQHSER